MKMGTVKRWKSIGWLVAGASALAACGGASSDEQSGESLAVASAPVATEAAADEDSADAAPATDAPADDVDAAPATEAPVATEAAADEPVEDAVAETEPTPSTTTIRGRVLPASKASSAVRTPARTCELAGATRPVSMPVSSSPITPRSGVSGASSTPAPA